MIVNKPTDKKKKKTSRYTVLFIIMGIIFGSIILRLLYVQVFSYEKYKERADVTSTRFVADKAPRGKIYDQKGNVLATNIKTYTITYTKTDNSDKQFYTTMKELFKILDENNEKIQDTLPLKINAENQIYFEYTSSEKESQNYEELRFKKDRGISDTLKNTMFKEKVELSDEQSLQLDEALLKKTPEDSFYDLVRSYNLIELVDPDYKLIKSKANEYKQMSNKELTDVILNKGYTINDIRKFMVVKDSIKMQSFKGDRVATIAGNIKRDTAFIVYQKKYDLSGIDISLAPIRYYPFETLASSVLGYVYPINDTQKEKYELKGYDVSSDLIGASGIESAFEEQLKGVKGGTTVKVNSQGSVTQELFKLESYPGNDVHLTIDNNIQYAGEQGLVDAMEELQKNKTDDKANDGTKFPNATRGAIAAVEVKTGRILSLASYPNFNPNLFAVRGQLTSEQTAQYFNPDYKKFGEELIQRMGLSKTVDDLFPLKDKYRTDKDRTDKYDLYPRPMYNYATMSLIQPGSTFKPLTAIAGLESGAISTDTVIVDKGKFTEHPETFGTGFDPGSDLEGASGRTTLTRAIKESVNYYFYETAYKMYIQKLDQGKSKIEALDSIAEYAWKFGLGVDPNSKEKPSTGIEIDEKFGETYNFKSSKDNIIAISKYNLVDILEKDCKYNGSTFIKFDISISDNDNDKVKNSKKAIKDKVAESLNKVGVDEKSMMTHEAFAEDVKKDITNIMEYSDIYKKNVAEYESNGRKANLETQAKIVAEAIAQFTINDQVGQIRTPAQLIYASIGQGTNSFTPMQLLSYISTFANGGTRYKLHLVDKITDNDGKIVQEFKPEVLDTVSISKSTKDAVDRGMEAVNNEIGGTARDAFLGFPIITAGKTGTADFAHDQRENGRKPYATYVSYAPAKDPQIAVVSVVFDGGHGGNIASATRAIYEAYFKDELLKDPTYASKSASFKKYVVDNPYNKNQSAPQVSTSNTENVKLDNNTTGARD